MRKPSKKRQCIAHAYATTPTIRQSLYIPLRELHILSEPRLLDMSCFAMTTADSCETAAGSCTWQVHKQENEGWLWHERGLQTAGCASGLCER